MLSPRRLATARQQIDHRQLRELAQLLCGDDGPRYRTRRELVELFARFDVTIEEPAVGSRRQLAIAGLEVLRHRPDGLRNIVDAITADSPQSKNPFRDRDHLLEDVLELIRRRFGDVIGRPRAPVGRGTYRPCFRLQLGAAGAAWLDAFLQSTRDPSLVVPLE